VKTLMIPRIPKLPCFASTSYARFPQRSLRLNSSRPAGAWLGSRLVPTVIVAVMVPAGAVLLSSTAKPGSALDSAQGQWIPPAAESRSGDGALFVHKKLMEVRTTDSGVPVLRFVECRHYATEHKKLIQTGVTASGLPVLKFVPGDYCILLGAEVGAPNPATVQVRAASLVNLRVTMSNMATPSFQRNWDTHFLGHPMTYYQQYTCDKFGPTCRVALAIQAAENLKGDCEAYHYNSDGTLDWGYFQINTVHLTRRGVNLRDLLDCKANVDFAYQLYREEGFQPWSTYVDGEYRKFLDDSLPNGITDPRPRHSPERLLLADIF
jgi:hypothetical protein